MPLQAILASCHAAKLQFKNPQPCFPCHHVPQVLESPSDKMKIGVWSLFSREFLGEVLTNMSSPVLCAHLREHALQPVCWTSCGPLSNS